MIELENVRFQYPRTRFHLLVDSWSVPAGRQLAVIGPSGVGKTTLMNLIAGIAVTNSGRVAVDDVEVSALNAARRRAFRSRTIGFVFQEFELLDHLTVADNIRLPFLVTPVGKSGDASAQRESTLLALAKRLGLEDKLGRRPGALSHGERQRVAIGRALITHPRLILADEPTGNLDPETGRAILHLIQSEARERGATLLVVTHDHSLLDAFDDVVDCRTFNIAVPAHGGGSSAAVASSERGTA